MVKMIDGVVLHPLKQIKGSKGDVWHAFKVTDEGYVGFGEAYLSQIKSHEIKGWKRHNKYVLNLVVIVGKIKFVLYDDRDNSPTKGQFEEVILSPNSNYQRLTIAPGIWMAFEGIDVCQTSMLIDFIPELHIDNECDSRNLDEIKYEFVL